MKVRSPLSLLLISVCSLALWSCSPYEQDSYQQEYIVEAYLIAGQQFPDVTLTTSSELFDSFTLRDQRVDGATVIIESGDTGQLMTYQQIDSSGIYTPTDTTQKIEATATYDLTIDIPDKDTPIRATTTVPEPLTVLGGITDRVVYQSSEQLEILVSGSPAGQQRFFIFNTIADDPKSEDLTPFYKSTLEDSDGDVVIEDFYKVSSGILNEANFFDENGNTVLRLPWLAVSFYGPNAIVANVLDKNSYDFVRSQSVQLGGSTLSPGEIQNVINHVEGAVGIFGSISSDTIYTTIERNPLLDFSPVDPDKAMQ
ncbi:MAG: DUF4249 family protein [Balneolaceae bacterium]|nr:DUF4249 family protein [Balneolaceae bacterium]MDR9446274.1 DUF4249 family protein [Balneolaceae bacterium]